jgi:hypothetical protein
MSVLRHSEIGVQAAFAALGRLAAPANGADRLALRVVSEHVDDLAAVNQEAASEIRAVVDGLARAMRLGEDDQAQAVKDLQRLAADLGGR